MFKVTIRVEDDEEVKYVIAEVMMHDGDRITTKCEYIKGTD